MSFTQHSQLFEAHDLQVWVSILESFDIGLFDGWFGVVDDVNDIFGFLQWIYERLKQMWIQIDGFCLCFKEGVLDCVFSERVVGGYDWNGLGHGAYKIF